MNEFGNVTLQNKTEGPLKWTLEAILEHPDAYRAKHNPARALLPLTATARSSARPASRRLTSTGGSTITRIKNLSGSSRKNSSRPDYDYDVLFDGLITKVHEQGFGTSV